jgi:DNA-binding response OmpR family regulator
MHKILIIDRGRLGGRLAPLFDREGLAATLQPDPGVGLLSARENKPQLLLLNVPLSGMTPADFCRRLRECPGRLPLVVMGVDDEAERVRLFEAGADDYLVKPFSLRELLARVRAILRRTAGVPGKSIHFGGIEADLDRRLVMRDGKEVGFTRMEYNLFAFFVRNAGRVVPREEVLNAVWGYSGGVRTRTADVHVMRLRRKLECDPASPRHLRTVHGIGYRFLM